MKQLKYITICACLLAMSACSPEKIAPEDEMGNSAEVCLVANISGSGNGSRADDNTPSYIKTHFTDNDEIRLVNTFLFSTPDFTDQKTIFTCTGEHDAQNRYKFIPSNESSTGNNPDGTGDATGDTSGTIGITWDNFTPTVFAYTFEASYYPGNQYF